MTNISWATRRLMIGALPIWLAAYASEPPDTPKLSERMAAGRAENVEYRQAHLEVVVVNTQPNPAAKREDPCYIKGYVGGLPYFIFTPGPDCPIDAKKEGKDCSGILRPNCEQP